MNKLFIVAGTTALDLVTAAPASATASTAEAKGSLLQRCFNFLRFRKTAHQRIDPMVSVNSQLIDEKVCEPDKHQSPLYDLAVNNPYVIATSVFSRKYR